MGNFDSFFLMTKCPYCGRKWPSEIQTKRFDLVMDEWRPGSKFESVGFDIHEGVIKKLTVDCESSDCIRHMILKDGHKYNQPRTFYCDVVIKEAKVEKAINERPKGDG